MATYVSNRKAVVARIDQKVRQRVVEAGVEYERILQEEFRSPKTGRIYGAETEVAFNATGGGEREVTFASGTTLDGGVPVPNIVNFTANKGQQASKRLVKFVANRGRKWRDGKRNAGMHRASAPDEAPAIETGALRKGVSRIVTQFGEMRWRVVIGESIQSGRGAPTGKSQRSIAHMLEFGTDHMKPRPSWRTALAKLKAGYRVVSRKKKKG